MADRPLVSVVMIFLNAERFIAEAIESVLAQTYPTWELILVDDGSTDGSSAIAERYRALHPERIRSVAHAGRANLGMSASRNAGISIAGGDLIAFLDADDVYLPEKLERQVALLRSHPAAAMVYGATLHWYSWTGIPGGGGRDRRRKLGVPPDTLVRPPALVPLFLRPEAQTPGICGVLIRREAIAAVGGFENRFRGMFEDQVFFYKLCLRMPVFVEGGSWDRYRQHPDSHSWSMRRLGRYRARGPSPASRAFLDWLVGYLEEQGIDDAAIRAALDGQLWPFRHPIRYRLRAIAGRLGGAIARRSRPSGMWQTATGWRAAILHRRVGAIRGRAGRSERNVS